MSALTRILNNQIYNGTIIASQKIAAGTITGSLFSSNVTVPGDLLISGNLFVLGTSAYTTIASTNTYVNDPLITLNNGFSGTNTYDEGLIFNRGTLQNRAFLWSEFNQEFRLIGTTETGTTYGNVTVSNYANLHLGNLTVDYAISTSGSISTPGEVSVGSLNSTANVLATGGVFNSLTVNGNESVTGYLNVTGNVMAAVVTASQLNTTGNVLATAGTFNALTVNGNESVTGYLNVTGNVMASAGTLSGLTVNGATTQNGTLSVSSGFINSSGNILATAATFNDLTVNGNELVTGYLNVTGNVMAAVVTASQLNTTGNVLATAATFNSLTVNGNESVTGYLNVTGNVMADVVTASAFNTTGNLLASTVGASFLTASTVAVGNISAVTVGNVGTQFNGAAINLSGNVLATSGTFNGLTVNGNETVTGYLNVTGNILGDTGTLSVLGVSNTLWANSSAATTTQGTGALIIPTGGISVAGAANIAGATTIGGAVQLNNTLSVGGIEYITNTTNATGPFNSGALQVAGGASVAKDVWIGGNLYVANIFATTQNTLVVSDPLVYFDAANTYPYNYDIGFYSNFVGPDPVTGTGNVYQHTGVVRDNSDYTWKFVSNVRQEPDGGMPIDSDTIYDPVKAGNLRLTYTQAASSTTTGALQVAGGAGIGGSLYARDIQATVIGNVTPAAGTFTTVNATGNVIATNITAGSVNTTGNVSAATLIAGQINTTGNVLAATVGASYVTASTATFGNISAVTIGNTGAYLTGEILNITGNALLGLTEAAAINSTPIGNASASTGAFTTLSASEGIWANSTTDSTSTTTGSIVSAGGLGLAGNIFQGGAYHDTSATNALLFNTPTIVDAFKSATSIEFGATTGTVLINNPTVEGSQATQGLFSSSLTTTMNFATKATSVNIGKADSVTTINGNANIRATTKSITYTQGALVTAGGAGVAGNVSIAGGQRLTIGTELVSGVVYPENQVQIVANANSAVRSYIYNQSLGTAASSEFVAASTGSNVTSIVSMGITGPGYNQPDGVAPGTGYVIVNGGDLLLSASNDIAFIANNALVAAVDAINSNVTIFSNTISTSSTSGALTVVGGVGINANLYVNNGATFNYGQSSEDFVVQGKVTTSLIRAVSDYGAVIIGGSNATPSLGAVAKFNSTDSIHLPVGTSSQRPGSSGNTDLTGMIRFNTTINNLEFYDGTLWQTPGGTFTVITSRQFAGNTAGSYGNVDGTNTAFTLQSSSTTSATIVSINGVLQIPVLAYSVSGDTLTFTEPPAPGDIIDSRVLSTTVTVSALATGDGYDQFIAEDGIGAGIWTGTSATTRRVLVDKVGNMNLLTGNKLTYTQTAVNVPATGATQIDTWGQSIYTTAKYVIQAKVGATNFESYEAMIMTDGAGNAYVSTYGIINNGTSFGTITANVVAGNVNVYYNTTIAQANVKAFGTFIV